MQTPDEIGRDLPTDLDDQEREELATAGIRLQAQRPVPSAGFRGELRRALLSDATQIAPAPPRSVLALSASYAGVGIVLLGIAAAGVAGAGPFATP